MKILEIQGQQVYVETSGGLRIWVPKQMLRQFGAKPSDIKVGRTLG